MKQVKVNLKINDYELQTTGYLNNNILSFNDKDINKTNIIYDFNSDTLIRNNDEIMIKLLFNKEKENVLYELKNNNCKFSNQLTKLSLHKTPTSVIIKYRIENLQFNMELSYMEANNGY